MASLIVILSLLFIMLVFSVYFSCRPVTVVEKRQMRETDKTALGKTLVEAAKSMRVSEKGGTGVNCVGMYREIVKADRAITAKVNAKIPLEESEKWLYENFYLIYRYVFGKKENMRVLPHIDGVPRVVKLARIIVDNSLGDLNPQRVRYLLGQIKGVLNLGFGELRAFGDALAYAEIEQLYILSQRLNYHNACKKKARNGKFNKKYIARDVYLYHLFNSGKLTDSSELEMKRLGIDEKSVYVGYNAVLMQNTVAAETLFGALREINAFVPVQIGLKYSAAYQYLSKTNNFENMSVQTLLDYFYKIEKISDECGVSEEYTANILSALAKKNGKDISTVLFDHYCELKNCVKTDKTVKLRTKKPILECLYSASVFLVAAGGASGVGIWLDSVFFGIMSFIPLFFIAENVINYLLSHLKTGISVPRAGYTEIPYEYYTTVVISEYIGSLKQLKESVFHAQTILDGNRDDNISVALLIDTKGSDAAVGDLDAEIINYAQNTDFGKNFNIFIRKKSYCDKKYIAKERKRGAIMALCRLLIMREDFEFIYVKNKNFVTPNFVVTLDADNTVLPGEIKSMINAMAHPYNRKYDLLTMHSRNSLFSAKTVYSMRFLSESGYETYPNYSGLYYKLFQKDVFCGKGIFRLQPFFNKLEEILPSKKILSHDILEGSILSTGEGGMCFEDAPSGFLSDRERRKRWQRGDIQLLPFIFGLWKTDGGTFCKNTFSPLGRFIISKNILANLKAPCIAVLLLAGYIVSPLAFYVALGIFAAPYAVNAVKILRGHTFRQKFSVIASNSLKNIVFCVEDFFMLAYYAVSDLALLAVTFTRMALKKNLLEWKTYYNSQNSNDFASYAREYALPVVVWTALCVVLWLSVGNMLPLFIWLLCSAAVYMIVFCQSKITVGDKNIGDEAKDELFSLAENTYKYFCFVRNDNGLLPDNIQLKPYKGESKTTSPTDIGFGILSEICAFYLDLISYNECVFNIGKTISAIESLPKWNGLLYNWYSLDKKTPVNQFVSSVDNGNLLAVFLLLKEFLKEKGDAVNYLKVDFLIKNFKIDKLFDNAKNLFFIGFDGKKYCGHYDLLASEARILSLVYIALYNDTTHYSCLQRDYISRGGNTLLSWSGTMFESVMSDIFFALPKKSLLYASSAYNVRCQRRIKNEGMWGVSESGYYAFDGGLRFQYKAFGVKELALCPDVTGRVVTPYASVLGLGYAPDAVVKNLAEMKKRGMTFEYGMYESIDFERDGKIVYSAMSHHQGMILASITNFLCNDILKRLLCKSPKICAVTSYFNEVQPNVGFMSVKYEKHKKYTNSNVSYCKIFDKIEQQIECAALSDTEYSIICNALGGGYSKIGDIYLNVFTGVYEENCGMFFYAKNEENIWKSPTYLPLCQKSEDYIFGYESDAVTYSCRGGELVENVALIPSLCGEVRKFSVSDEYNEAAFYCDLGMDTLDGYFSHPCFSGMFFDVSIAGADILSVVKRVRGEPNSERCVVVRVEGLKNIRWECNRLNFIGREGSLSSPLFLGSENGKSDYPSVGDVLCPCIGFRGDFSGREKSCQVTVLYGSDEKSLIRTISSLPRDMYKYARQSPQKYPVGEYTQSLIGGLVYASYSRSVLNNVAESGKETAFMDFNGGAKTVQYEFDGKKIENFNKITDAIAEMRPFGIKAKLVIYSSEKLSENVEKYVTDTIEEKKLEEYAVISGSCEEKYRAFLNVDSDLLFKPFRYNPNKNFYARCNLLNYKASIAAPDIAFAAGNGGYDGQGRYVCFGQKPTLLPYSHVIADARGGLVVTAGGGGFYYFGNSREDKAVRFDNDYVTDGGGEFFYVKTVGGYAPVSGGGACGYSVIEKGLYTRVTDYGAVKTRLSETVICDGKAKVAEIKVSRQTGEYVEFLYGFYPCLNWRYSPCFVTFTQFGDLTEIRNVQNGKHFFVKIIGVKKDNLTVSSDNDSLPFFEYFCENEEEKFFIVSSEDVSLLHSLTTDNIPFYISRALEFFRSVNDVKFESPIKSFDYLANFLQYQVFASRLCAKAGYYQVGGATGFRDQLQDSLAFFTRPEILRERITAACEHQYEEGDVMHWWHEPNYGLRSRITDDRLFLPLCVCSYVRYSGDVDFLQCVLPYLSSPPLAPESKDRFENPQKTDYGETVFKHCLRAVRSSLRYGEHKLPVMGGGDWNDGMDAVCAAGRGESVFNAMLCYKVLTEFAELCPDDLKKEMNTIAAEMKNAVNLYAYEDDRYLRLCSDDGRWLGSARSNTLTLDLLTQAFAVISGVADGERAVKCLETAESLIDADAGIIKLLAPPQTRNDYIGYISDYPKGIRENGGQYTHAAIWYLIALTEAGRQDEAFSLFQMINPVEKCADKKKNSMYMAEPYVLCGDVYSNKDNYGRAGWSWYTGSAAWAYKLVAEEFFGLHRRGGFLYIKPKLPKALGGSKIVYIYKNSEYRIEYSFGLTDKIVSDGAETDKIALEENVRKVITVETAGI
jgi:cyclic beta-1,2-glucan synthetase